MSDQVIVYIETEIKSKSMQKQLYNLLYNSTGNLEFKHKLDSIENNQNLIYQPKNKDQWLNVIEDLKTKLDNPKLDQKSWFYQGYLIAILIANYPFSISEIAKIKVIRQLSPDSVFINTDNLYLLNERKIFLSSKSKSKFGQNELTIDPPINDILHKWFTEYNLTDYLIINRNGTTPSNIENYISRQIFPEFHFPRLK